MKLTPIKKTFRYGDHVVTLETGRIARQANSVLVDMDGTVVLVALVAEKEASQVRDFFPLTVNYQERSYAAGRIPGGFLKREGRPSEREILVSRLIDRPLRPLFPEGFHNEVQITATVMSMNPNVESDIAAMLGASAAAALSGAPFNGPIGAARVGYKDGMFLLNPSIAQMQTSELDLVVAGTKSSVLMVESEAKVLSEEVMLNAVVYGHEQMQVAIAAIEEFVKMAGATSWGWQAPKADTALESELSKLVEASLVKAYQIQEKQARGAEVKALRQRAVEGLSGESDDAPSAQKIESMFHDLEKRIVRERILSQQPRIDGRDLLTVRPIAIETSVLPRVHGSALFTRGETQAVVAATLGTEKDSQLLDSPLGESKDLFMLHYNFPPYCVGETGQASSPKRREIGHGRLAKRGVSPVLPTFAEFPYVLRVVSEITESNGSSSMASVCGTSLALMDAGVPLKAPVAGIAMGLIKEGNRTAVLTDILGDEDHLGDMDFKVAGTSEGVTALQMDIKIDGITRDIMEQALVQAKAGRLHILGLMNEVISAPRQDISDYAPRIMTFMINPEKIREVIGKGGVVIRALTEETKTVIELEDNGTVRIISSDANASNEARRRIEQIAAEVEVGKVYTGKVTRIAEFGAFVSLIGTKEGLVHISQITNERVNDVNDYLSLGQTVNVKVVEIDRQGRVRLTMKEVEQQEATTA